MPTTRTAVALLSACLATCTLNPSRTVEVPPGYEPVVAVRGREKAHLFPGQRVDITLRDEGLREQYEDVALVGLQPQQRWLAFEIQGRGLVVAPLERVAVVKEVRSVAPFVLVGTILGSVLGVVAAAWSLEGAGGGDPTAIVALGLPFLGAGLGVGAGAATGAIFKNVNAWHGIGPQRKQWQFQLPDGSLLPEPATATSAPAPRG